MNDLPNQSTNNPINTNTPINQSQSVQMDTAVGSSNKETGLTGGLETGLQDIGRQELDLPKEVVSAGVHMHPTTVAIPAPVASLGVKPAGSNQPFTPAPTVVMPLSDDQIAKGLHMGVTSSWRWLSEWCLLRMRRFHVAFQLMHGKIVRST